jgi:hypothetical protein
MFYASGPGHATVLFGKNYSSVAQMKMQKQIHQRGLAQKSVVCLKFSMKVPQEQPKTFSRAASGSPEANETARLHCPGLGFDGGSVWDLERTWIWPL